eukprot:scaffold22946_cov90-Skeletonema_dohrnii-CCMP3373.AAC.2
MSHKRLLIAVKTIWCFNVAYCIPKGQVCGTVPDMVSESCWRPSQSGPHQVEYDAVAWLIRVGRA